MDVVKEITKRVFRIPMFWHNMPGNGEKSARQLDVALMKAGFKLSQEALNYFGSLHPSLVTDIGKTVISAICELVGDHVKHNVYFRDFPNNVPDTVEFWVECIADALMDHDTAAKIELQLSFGVVNLLDLPKYGRYQHSYEEMIVAHEAFMPLVKRNVKILNLGKNLPTETLTLYHGLAESKVPLNESDRKLLGDLAEACLSDAQPERIPIRENKAIINMVRLQNKQTILVDTPTDVLRLACALSGGDVTLEKLTKFKSFKRVVRTSLMKALNEVVEKSSAKLSDINQYSERWKRLGERIHPHEYGRFPHAQDVFSVARGEKKAMSFAAKVEMAFADNDTKKVISLLGAAPGLLFRSLDRILRSSTARYDASLLMEEIVRVLPKVSGRVILSVREHLQNRTRFREARIFANKKGTAFAMADQRGVLYRDIAEKFLVILDEEILKRIPVYNNLVVDRNILTVALPLSEKNKTHGFGILPRGSISPVSDGILRFFIYWKQCHERTDYDLSVVMYDEDFQHGEHLSYTNLQVGGGVHSGDITSAPNGASEFIDIDLRKIRASYIIPSVNLFAGEDFASVEECFFGFMERVLKEKGQPFEPATVKMKSDLSGKGKVALPLVFVKDNDGLWAAKWLHFYMPGLKFSNRVELNKISSGLLAKTVVDRDYLTFEYLVGLMVRRGDGFRWYRGQKFEEPVTFVGLEVPENLPEGSKFYALNNLRDLIPA